MRLEFLSVDTSTSLLVGILAAVLASVLLRILNNRKYPPGPWGLPIVGYLPFLTKHPHLKLIELAKKYGSVYSLGFGGQNVVVLCNYSSIRECFPQDSSMGRPPDSFFELNPETIESGAFHDIGWKEQKRYSLQSLRDLGFGKSRMEVHLREEIEELLDHIQQTKGKSVVPENYLTPSASNVIASLMFGKRRKFDDPKRILLDKLFQESRTEVSKLIVLSYFPNLLKFLRFTGLGVSKAWRINEEFKNYVSEEIEEHRKSFDPNNIRDFIDGYLLEIEKKKEDTKSLFKVPVLKDIIQLFFGAGSETIMATVDWLILISAAFPEVQKRVQSEIDSVLGSERFPSRSDYLQMPYTEAVILETLRWRANLPINIPRYTLADMRVHSYIIPKHTQVIGVFWAINHDPLLWGKDVETFRPERFFSHDEKHVRKPEYFIPFSIGRRSCPGEALANVAMFLYFVAILQKFNIRFEEGFEPDLEGQLVFGMQTKPYKAIFELRNI